MSRDISKFTTLDQFMAEDKVVKEKIDNTALLADNKLRVIHFNRIDFGGRSMTLAYRGTRSMVEVATSITHPDDTFTKKIGTKTAAESFIKGKTINIPVPSEWQGHTGEFLITLFSVV